MNTLRNTIAPSHAIPQVEGVRQAVLGHVPARRQAGFDFSAAALELGQMVKHAVFGEGVILNFEGAGAQARVQVNFSEGSKWLMMGYAKLEAV